MSRSFRKTPIMGISGGNSCQKYFKKQEHSRERTLVHQQLNKLDCDLPSPKQFGNEWDSPRDGKMWFGNCKYKQASLFINWPEEYKKWMRK